MKRKVNWKRVILISVIAVAVAFLFVTGNLNPKRWILYPKRLQKGLVSSVSAQGYRMVELGYKLMAWRVGRKADELELHERLFVDWDSYQASGGRALMVQGQTTFRRPPWAWNLYIFDPERGVWLGGTVLEETGRVSPHSPMYQRLEEIRKHIKLPEVEDD